MKRSQTGGLPPRLRSILLVVLGLAGVIVAACPAGAAAAHAAAGPPSVILGIRRIDRNILDDRTPGMAGVKYGVEGGEVVRDAHGIFHLFTCEQFGDPYWVANRITHWTSKDGLRWHRDTRWTKEGNHDQTGTREKSSYFDPRVAYDEKTGYWYLFYVAYRYSPAKTWYVAKIYRAKAVRPGRAGLGGPYHDNDADDVVVLGPVEHPGPYEAKWVGDTKSGYGAASVTLYQAGHDWVMLWAENMLATAPTPGVTFTRLAEGPLNPVTFGRPRMGWITNYIFTPIQKHFYFENPIVIRIPKGRAGAGTYLMATGNYTDASLGITHQTCGYATSQDGLRWSQMRPINPGFGDCATVLSFLPAADGGYTMYITSHDKVEETAGTLQSTGTVDVPSYERVSRIEVTAACRRAGCSP